MAGHFMPMFSNNKVVFFVMFFYIFKKFRKYIQRFVNCVTNFIKSFASGIVIASPYGEESYKRERLYKIMRFKPVETHFMRCF